MAWKKYSTMSPEEKKASWAKFRTSAKNKALQNKHKEPEHTSAHKFEPNAGGYCKSCSYGRDHS